MKSLISACFIVALVFNSFSHNKDDFGKGYYRITYYNVLECKTELQSFDSTITEKKLDNLRSFLYKFGAKDRGIENEFPSYRVYDFTKKSRTPEALTEYASQQIKDFEKSIEKLKNAPVEKEFATVKEELINNYSKRIAFEKIVSDWYKTKDDKHFRKRITEFYTDEYIQATLDKTLALKGMDKLCYTYVELYDIVFARIFGWDRIQHLQNKLMHDYKIEVVIGTCNKS